MPVQLYPVEDSKNINVIDVRNGYAKTYFLLTSRNYGRTNHNAASPQAAVTLCDTLRRLSRTTDPLRLLRFAAFAFPKNPAEAAMCYVSARYRLSNKEKVTGVATL